MEVSGKVCIITGSSRGLGKAFAARLLEAGGKVCISGVNQDRGEVALAEFRERFGEEMVCFVVCDVTEEEQFRNLFDKAEEFFKVSCVDLLVNNAGINVNFGWKKCLDVNIVSVMLGTEIALERMRKAGKSGQIINTASMAGLGPWLSERMTAYTVSKHGVVSLTRSLGNTIEEVAYKCICPSWAETEIITNNPLQGRTEFNQSTKECGGMMTPEYVAEGFYRLITECDTGAVMAVMPGTPHFIIPDTSTISLVTFVLLAKLCGRMFGVNVLKAHHLAILFLVIVFIFHYFLSVIF